MNIDLARKTELIRRKVKTILFDRQNRRLSDKMYDDLGTFFERLNKEGVLIPDKYFERVNGGLDKLYALNTKRIDDLNRDMDKDMQRMDERLQQREQSINNAFNTLGIKEENDFKEQIGK